ncbi:hypothetical protein QR680_002591 [Steinernema hermaphroditum]|uniref:Uncharacterized protein n=1 Tax=Steinernema hermaphroditum TaxID=289476 RepID=A0AA39H470_9BILA|nr:hypothetical protein QR680_002591 [Steinernema hermaphroditum]
MPSARTEVIIRQDVFERVEATVSMRRPSAQPESSADSSDRPGPSGTAQQLDEQLREILGDLEIPDGVDPAFLAALPEDMRREVIRDHLRQQGRVSVARSQPAESIVGAPVVVNENADGEGDDANANLSPPLDQEFLTALPPELQQELIEQHERDVRLAREAQNPPSNPPVEEPVDHGALLESLPPSLRAQVLADADDSLKRNDSTPRETTLWLLSRAVFEPSGFSGFGRNRCAGPSLHRQNAVRRYPPSHMFGTSTLDDAFIDFRLRDGRDYMGEGQARRKFGTGGSKPAAIPTALESFIDSSRIFDPNSVTYVFALLCAYYTAEPLSKMSSVRYWSLSGEDRTQEVEK